MASIAKHIFAHPWNGILQRLGVASRVAASRKTLECYPLQEQDLLALVGLEFRASAPDPCLYFVFRPKGGAVGALTTNTDDALGRGETDVLRSARNYSEIRFGYLDLQGRKFAHVGMEVAQAADFSRPRQS